MWGLLQWPAEHLWGSRRGHLHGSAVPRVELEGVPGAHAPRAACALPALGLRDPHVDELAHLLPFVEHRLG